MVNRTVWNPNGLREYERGWGKWEIMEDMVGVEAAVEGLNPYFCPHTPHITLPIPSVVKLHPSRSSGRRKNNLLTLAIRFNLGNKCPFNGL